MTMMPTTITLTTFSRYSATSVIILMVHTICRTIGWWFSFLLTRVFLFLQNFFEFQTSISCWLFEPWWWLIVSILRWCCYYIFHLYWSRKLILLIPWLFLAFLVSWDRATSLKIFSRAHDSWLWLFVFTSLTVWIVFLQWLLPLWWNIQISFQWLCTFH